FPRRDGLRHFALAIVRQAARRDDRDGTHSGQDEESQLERPQARILVDGDGGIHLGRRGIRLRQHLAEALIAHCSCALSPGRSAVVAMAPALTVGLRGCPWLSSIAITELKASPVLSTPSISRIFSLPNLSHSRA